MSITGGIQVGGNLGAIPGGLLAGSPSFQIGPRSPFKGMSQEELNKLKEWDSRPGDLQKYYEQQNRPGPQLPFAGIPGDVGNFGGLIAQAQPQTLKDLIGNREGGMSDIPGDVRFRQDTQFLPYNPGNYAQNSKQNPLRNYRWPASFNPGSLQPGIRPYFGNKQGPGLYGEMGTGAI